MMLSMPTHPAGVTKSLEKSAGWVLHTSPNWIGICHGKYWPSRSISWRSWYAGKQLSVWHTRSLGLPVYKHLQCFKCCVLILSCYSFILLILVQNVLGFSSPNLEVWMNTGFWMPVELWSPQINRLPDVSSENIFILALAFSKVSGHYNASQK